MSKWLQCQVDRGMFSSESTITYPSSGTPKFSVFVPISEVRGEPGTIGKVRVGVIQNGDFTYAILPTSYSDSEPVSLSDLSDEP
ncbi:MAG: hypothetical protein ACRC8S_15110 [Fimbriiglobus sp.]